MAYPFPFSICTSINQSKEKAWRCDEGKEGIKKRKRDEGEETCFDSGEGSRLEWMLKRWCLQFLAILSALDQRTHITFHTTVMLLYSIQWNRAFAWSMAWLPVLNLSIHSLLWQPRLWSLLLICTYMCTCSCHILASLLSNIISIKIFIFFVNIPTLAFRHSHKGVLLLVTSDSAFDVLRNVIKRGVERVRTGNQAILQAIARFHWTL